MKRSVIDVPDLSPEELDSLMDTAEDIIADHRQRPHCDRPGGGV